MRHLGSAANLIHYLGLRRRDMRPLQEKLAVIGLSSLGRAESRVLTNLHAIIVLLQRALGKPVEPMPSTAVDPSVTGSALLRSEERRVGKECRSRWAPHREHKSS